MGVAIRSSHPRSTAHRNAGSGPIAGPSAQDSPGTGALGDGQASVLRSELLQSDLRRNGEGAGASALAQTIDLCPTTLDERFGLLRTADGNGRRAGRVCGGQA
jgi:hypothetical protein